MKMRALLVSLSALAMAACGPLVEIGGDSGLSNGQSLAELTLEEFDSVSLRGPDNVVIALGDEFDIRVEGDDEAVADVEFEIRSGTLRIGRKNSHGLSMHDDAVTVYITMPVLNGASIAGSGDMQIDHAASDDFEASIAGSGSMAIAALEAARAEFDIAGSGDITAAGTVADLEIGIAGSGDVEAEELRVERADVDIAGSGSVEIFATETVSGSLIGSGDVRVTGGATCRASSIGSGDVRCN
jgi:Putative auto-transporter adhesin, head GIN domain